jgi:glutaconate CoA-transferase subunit B
VSTVDIPEYTSDEMMSVAAARQLRDGTSCFVGIGLPSTAANLARATHAPNLVLVYESGCIGAKPDRLPLSIGDGVLADTADTVVSVPEVFNYWLQPGRIDIGFLSAAQLDRFGNINTTVIGDYADPITRLPGAGGAPEIASACREVIMVVRQGKRTFVDNLDFVTSVGRPTMLITDLGILQPNAASGELTLTHLHPGVTVSAAVEATGWPLAVAADIAVTDPPTPAELTVLRRLEATKHNEKSVH